jgi:hypothetical protein
MSTAAAEDGEEILRYVYVWFVCVDKEEEKGDTPSSLATYVGLPEVK